jgi:hypothetical protein
VFVREKHISGYSYLYLVESVREDGRVKQRIIKNLGRKEVIVASGEFERLARSVADELMAWAWAPEHSNRKLAA